MSSSSVWTTVAVASATVGAVVLGAWWLTGRKGKRKDDEIAAAVREATYASNSAFPDAALTGESSTTLAQLCCDGGDGEAILLPTSFVEQYTLEDVIGSGLTSTVVAVTEKATGRPCAVKIVDKAKLEPGMLQYIDREVRILKELDHPAIIKLYNVVLTRRHIILVLERALGGELYDRLAAATYTEADARTVTSHLMSALAYLHSKGILHRDLKPENILLASPDNLTNIKLCDFGLAKWFMEDKPPAAAGGASGAVPLPPPGPPKLMRASTVCGSALYHAPEVVAGDYSFPCDWYSLGVILHFMLAGFVPETPDEELFVDPEWDGISEGAKDLVGRLLDTNPATRITGAEVAAHHWMKVAEPSLPHRPLVKAQTSMKELYAKPRAALRAQAHACSFLDALGREVELPSERSVAVLTAAASFKDSLKK